MLKYVINSVAKLWTQYNYNITFEINAKMIDVNIPRKYLFFAALYIDNRKLRRVADITNDFDLNITH